ncbi:MAG: GerMN domain-containing protein [Acidobacteria bacterium]|nr:GerMN domain-containing protein [Acidobacteriota bacterium]
MTPHRRMWTYLALGVLGAAVGVWLVTLWLPGWLVATRPTSEGPTGAAGLTGATGSAGPAGDTRRISATLFYVAPSGDALIPVEQEIPYAAAPAEQARRIVERQLAAAPSGQVSVIPAGTTLRALFLTARGEAYVDVSREIVTGHPGGSLHEFLTVYAIVNAITINLPDITAVQVLVDGREVDTLVGHLDLRHPLRRGIRWVRRTP